MKVNDKDLSGINTCASPVTSTSRSCWIKAIFLIAPLLMLIGAPTANSETPRLISKAACPNEYEFKNNMCVAKRSSYSPKQSSICFKGGTYIGSGQCVEINDAVGLIALDPNSAENYSVSCQKDETQDGGTCIKKCLSTHTMRNGKCHVKSANLSIESMICPGQSFRRGISCYDAGGAKRIKHALYIDCDHPKINKEWTKSIVTASLLDKTGRIMKQTTLDKTALNKVRCTNKFVKNTPAWYTETIEPPKYLGLVIKGNDGFYIDALRLQSDGKQVAWGKNGGKGWCMSTDPKDGKGSWKSVTDNNCHKALIFNVITGKVKKPR